MSTVTPSSTVSSGVRVRQGYDVLDFAETVRLDVARRLDKKQQANLGQFFTPAVIATRLANLLRPASKDVRLLDAGAGMGMLSAAAVKTLISKEAPPASLHLTAYEVDDDLHDDLRSVLETCARACSLVGVEYSYEIVGTDFLLDATYTLNAQLFAEREGYTCAVLNPPYKKIGRASEERRLLERVGVETGNLYAGFLALAAKLLAPDGELVSITPRSFCNGPYFKAFRTSFLSDMSISDLQVFEARGNNFGEVLQENLIMRAVRTMAKPDRVTMQSLTAPGDELPTVAYARYESVVRPDDPEAFIYVVTDGVEKQAAAAMGRFSCSLADLGLSVSTGKVVDFRIKGALRLEAEPGSVPLLYPHNLKDGFVAWPVAKRDKPQALRVTEKTKSQILPAERYVLVKRFTAKEEARRVVAALYEPKRLAAASVGIENHLNYFHRDGRGLPETLAKGLTVFLNSSLLDTYFRQFNGHTQVNATDLRSLNYPSRSELERLGAQVGKRFPAQDAVDRMVAMAFSQNDEAFDPASIKRKTDEAMEVLAALGLPRAQLNERSALTLLALIDLKPGDAWTEAAAPLMGITPLMDYMAEHYGKQYKPNTRETVRRQTMHQFVDAGVAVTNPDQPDRPPNSPGWVYQVEPSVLKLLRSYGSEAWEKGLQTYLDSVETLRERYAQRREMERIPVKFNEDVEVTLSPGGQNVLVEQVIGEFCPRFAPNGRVMYLGDTDEKMLYFDKTGLKELGVEIEQQGKIPDVVVHYTEKNWLLLIEAVTSHGPINPKRMSELEVMFKDAQAGLVYVTTFLTRKAMLEYVSEIAWETEVWVAESPGHMIHFNGKRFLGPYER